MLRDKDIKGTTPVAPKLHLYFDAALEHLRSSFIYLHSTVTSHKQRLTLELGLSLISVDLRQLLKFSSERGMSASEAMDVDADADTEIDRQEDTPVEG